METIQTKIENAIYGYDQNEFMPIYYMGRLANRGEFVQYKAEKVLKAAGRLAERALEGTVTVLEDYQQSFDQKFN